MLLSIFTGVKQNRILKPLISTAGTKRSTLTSHYASLNGFQLQITLRTNTTEPLLGGKFSQTEHGLCRCQQNVRMQYRKESGWHLPRERFSETLERFAAYLVNVTERN